MPYMGCEPHGSFILPLITSEVKFYNFSLNSSAKLSWLRTRSSQNVSLCKAGRKKLRPSLILKAEKDHRRDLGGICKT